MMENVCVGAKYDSKKFGMVVVISIDEKTKLVRFHKVNSDKQEIPMTTSSFKKGFRLAEMPAGQSEEKKATTKAPKAEKPAGESSKQSKKTEKKDKPEKAEKPKKEKVEALPVLDTIASILDSLNVEYKRNRDGINAKVFTVWKRKTKARFYISSESEEFNNLNEKLIENLHDNPTKNSKKDKSFYVEFSNLKPVIVSMLQ